MMNEHNWWPMARCSAVALELSNESCASLCDAHRCLTNNGELVGQTKQSLSESTRHFWDALDAVDIDTWRQLFTSIHVDSPETFWTSDSESDFMGGEGVALLTALDLYALFSEGGDGKLLLGERADEMQRALEFIGVFVQPTGHPPPEYSVPSSGALIDDVSPLSVQLELAARHDLRTETPSVESVQVIDYPLLSTSLASFLATRLSY